MRIINVECPECGEKCYYPVPEDGEREAWECDDCGAEFELEAELLEGSR